VRSVRFRLLWAPLDRVVFLKVATAANPSFVFVLVRHLFSFPILPYSIHTPDITYAFHCATPTLECQNAPGKPHCTTLSKTDQRDYLIPPQFPSQRLPTTPAFIYLVVGRSVHLNGLHAASAFRTGRCLNIHPDPASNAQHPVPSTQCSVPGAQCLGTHPAQVCHLGQSKWSDIERSAPAPLCSHLPPVLCVLLKGGREIARYPGPR